MLCAQEVTPKIGEKKKCIDAQHIEFIPHMPHKNAFTFLKFFIVVKKKNFFFDTYR